MKPPSLASAKAPGCAYPVLRERLVKPEPLAFYDLLGKNGDWWLVDLCEGEQGWILGSAVASNDRRGTIDSLPVIIPEIESSEESDTSGQFERCG